jgi:membrane associated rhomboid family serine protease
MRTSALLVLAVLQPCASLAGPRPPAAPLLTLRHGMSRRGQDDLPPRGEELPPQTVLRLRGGEGPSMLDKASNMYFGVPIVTRVWLSMILAFAGISQVGLVAPEMLAIDAGAMVGRMQLWRFVTCATFLGGLGMQLLQKLYYLVQFGAGFERTVGMGEYLRILFSCTATMALVCNLLGWQFVGDGLIMALTVLTCQQNPDQQMSLYMITIPCSYFPFAQLCMSYLFTQQIPWQDILGALVGYLHYHINDNTKPDNVFYKDLALAHAQGKGAAGNGGRKLGANDGGSSKPKTGGSSKKKGGGGSGGGGSAKKPKKRGVATFANTASCGPSG